MAYFNHPEAMVEALRGTGSCHEARLEFLALSEAEQVDRICDIIDETGIFDANENLKDNWREILAAYRKWRELL